MIFTAAGFPGATEHSAIHQALVVRAVELVARFKAGSLGIGELFQFLAHDVVARHLLGADREFFPFLDGGRAIGNVE
jgi:hemerythrin